MQTHNKWALAGASVLLVGVLGFASIQQTDAAWRSSATVGDGATITSGILEIAAGEDTTQSYDWDTFTIVNGVEGTSATMALQVFNTGNVGMGYSLADVTLTKETGASGVPPLDLRIATVNDEASCTGDTSGTQIYTGDMDQATFGTSTPRQVDANDSEWLCMTATIGSGAEANQAATATFTFDAVVDR